MLFDHLTSSPHLFEAWTAFCSGKRSRPDVMAYNQRLEENIFHLQHLLISGTYRHGAYMPFQINDPKSRRIHKATIQDRLLHQAIVSVIEPFFEPRFIFDSYSCRKSKGTHAATRRLRKFLRQASQNDTRSVFALKCDIKQFFASVDHIILMNLLAERIRDQQVLDILQDIIGSLPNATGRGIPLGNLTSQLFANIYLHEFDWFIKNQLRQKKYLRYCDDFIIIGNDRQELLDLIPIMANFLSEKLSLQLHPNKVTIRSWRQGIDFLGYVSKPRHTILRHKTKKRTLKRVTKENLSSYLGICSHANEYRLSQLLKTIAL